MTFFCTPQDADAGDRVNEKRLQFNISQRFAFLAHDRELSRLIARGVRLKRCLSGLFQYSVECSVVPYCVECTYWRSQNSNRIGLMLLDKSVDSKCLLRKTGSPWTHSILLIVKERWMPKQIVIIDLRGFVCADSANFFGLSLLNYSFRSESRATHALVRCVRIFMTSLWWNLVHSTHYS